MHVQTNARLAHHGTDKTDVVGDFEILTLQDLGRYLRNLRENKRVTQASLSTKTGAMAGRKVSRSRISEIENAKRDPVSERELRVYMVGLKCTPQHIDGLVKALRQSTVTPPREAPADPVTHSLAIPADPYPAGPGGAEDDLTLRKEKSQEAPTTAGHEEEACERWPQENTPIHLLDASHPQPSRRRWQRHHIALAAAATLVAVALTELGAEFFLQRESVDPPTFPSSPAGLLAPPNAPLILEANPHFIKNGNPPDPALAHIKKRSAQISTNQDRPDSGNTATRNTTEHPVGHCCVAPEQDQTVGAAVSPRVQPDWHRYTAKAKDGWWPNLGMNN